MHAPVGDALEGVGNVKKKKNASYPNKSDTEKNNNESK